MEKRPHYIYYIIIAAIVIFQLVTNNKGKQANIKTHDSQLLAVDFIDVGQGDAILVSTRQGKTMLIDAGDNSQEEAMVEYLRKKGVKRLDYLIGTHPHADHIGGLDAVIRAFDIGEIYMPKVSHTTETFKDVLLAVKEKGHTINTAKAGVTLDLGDYIEVEMVAPSGDSYNELNDYSAVIRLAYGDISFLFTGDAQKVSEDEMLGSGYGLDATVLKVGHHGSITSTTDEFLKKVKPKYAVISSKKDNSYGHPHKEVIQKLEEANVIYYDTQTNGSIIAITDGKTIEWSMENN